MKRIIGTIITFCFLIIGIFAQSTEYSKYLSKAKEYENKKQWAFALDAYYDALGCSDEPSLKIDARNGYIALSESIKNGNPGLGKYNPFTMHDEWKKLLIDAEKLGNSICKFELHLGKLEQADLNYETRTASYKSKVQIEVSDRFTKTIAVIEKGYKAAYKSDWTDLPKANTWPFYSVSSAKNAAYDVAGAKIFEVPSRQKNMPSEYYNAFSVFSWGYNVFYSYRRSNDFNRTLYDYKFNIVDENGKELVKGNRWLLSFKTRFAGLQHTPQGDIELLENEPSEIIIDGITPSVMDLIDNGKAFINPVAVYLEYGKYNRDDDKVKVVFNHNDGRTFIKNLPEIQLDISKAMIYCWNKAEDINAIRFDKTINKTITDPFIKSHDEITGHDYTINDTKLGSLQRAATDTEKIIDENTLIDVVKLYFEEISTKGIIVDDYKTLKFEIPLDKAYTDNDSMGKIFKLKDSTGKLFKINKESFLETLNKITKLEYSMINHDRKYYLQRDATDTEKTAYEDLRKISLNDAVKLYFEKISVNGEIYEYMGYDLFEIPLDNSYNNDYSYFTLKDTTGKVWKISKDDFLTILKKIVNQEYRINGTRLSRTPTEEDINLRKSAWNNVIKLYFEKISKNGKINGEKELFSIPLDRSFSVGSFNLEDSSGKSWKIKENDFLEILKEITNQDYSIDYSTDTLFRNLTDEERAKEMNQRKSAWIEAIKLYFEKISKNGKINGEKGIFSIPLDSSFMVGSFYLKDSSEKSWKIKENDFLEILKEITNQDYTIVHSTDTLYRKLTDEEKATYKNAKQKYQ